MHQKQRQRAEERVCHPPDKTRGARRQAVETGLLLLSSFFLLVRIVGATPDPTARTPAPENCLPREALAAQLAPSSLTLLDESAGTELAELQMRTGLSLVATKLGQIQFFDFTLREWRKLKDLIHGNTGAVSPDGHQVAVLIPPILTRHLGIMGSDGSDFRDYPSIVGADEMCWSLDSSKLTVRAVVHGDGKYSPPGLQIIAASTEATQSIGHDGHVSSQCWSPDGKQIVYADGASLPNGKVRIYDLAQQTERILCDGSKPSWSPDGRRIAFLYRGTYYEVSPSGGEQRKLFKKWHPASGLLWSPDSRFVAYVSQAGLFEGMLSALDVEIYWLRVRRLQDNSEVRLAQNVGAENYQWVADPELIRK